MWLFQIDLQKIQIFQSTFGISHKGLVTEKHTFTLMGTSNEPLLRNKFYKIISLKSHLFDRVRTFSVMTR